MIAARANRKTNAFVVMPNRPYQLFGKRAVAFLLRQGKDIRQGGMRSLVRKCVTFVEGGLSIIVVLAVRILRPLVVIRFKQLHSSKIGPFAANTEVYLCERDAGMHGQRTIDLFYHQPTVCNRQLKKMWDRTLHVTWFAGSIDRANRLLPGGGDHVVRWRRDADRDIHGLLGRMQPHLNFTAEEEHLGRELLRKLGIPEGSPFVCFHARDSAYLDTVYPNGNWRYHDYRDSSIDNFVPAVEELTRRGYFAIRLGAVVKKGLTATNPWILDYATNGRSEFMDIFLSAKCSFFLGDNSGLSTLPMIFRRPRAIVNFLPLEYAWTWSATDLFIPRMLWLREERRLLTFREILNSGVGRFFRTEQYEQSGIEVVENDPAEIMAVAVEIDERLKEIWQTTEEDAELQRRFWSLFKPSELHGVIRSHIGADFLRQNRELLE